MIPLSLESRKVYLKVVIRWCEWIFTKAFHSSREVEFTGQDGLLCGQVNAVNWPTGDCASRTGHQEGPEQDVDASLLVKSEFNIMICSITIQPSKV